MQTPTDHEELLYTEDLTVSLKPRKIDNSNNAVNDQDVIGRRNPIQRPTITPDKPAEAPSNTFEQAFDSLNHCLVYLSLIYQTSVVISKSIGLMTQIGIVPAYIDQLLPHFLYIDLVLRIKGDLLALYELTTGENKDPNKIIACVISTLTTALVLAGSCYAPYIAMAATALRFVQLTYSLYINLKQREKNEADGFRSFRKEANLTEPSSTRLATWIHVEKLTLMNIIRYTTELSLGLSNVVALALQGVDEIYVSDAGKIITIFYLAANLIYRNVIEPHITSRLEQIQQDFTRDVNQAVSSDVDAGVEVSDDVLNNLSNISR